MASQQMDKDPVMETQQQEEHQRISSTDVVVDSNVDEVVSVELPAPQGWTKKFTPKKGGTGTPRRNEIVFIAPTGEEIKNKRQLDQYLKSHTDGPPLSDFNWGTGDTPRRSARLSSKPKAMESPESGGSSRKRQRKSSSKKKETGGGESEEDEAPANKTEDEKTEDEKDVEMKDAGGAGNGTEEEKSEEKSHDEAAKEKTDEAKEQKEGDVETQPEETKPEEVQVPEVTNKEDQSEVSKVETSEDTTEPTKDNDQPEENKVQPAQEIVEQPKENKPEPVDKPFDKELPSDTNKAMEVEPAVKGDIEEKGEPANAENKPEGSNLVFAGSVKMTVSEDVGPGSNGGENQEGSLQTDNLVFVELPSDTNKAMKVEPAVKSDIAEKGEPANAENKPEGSNLVFDESVKMTASEDVGPGSNGGENQEGSLQTENQPVDPDDAPREPGAAQPISILRGVHPF